MKFKLFHEQLLHSLTLNLNPGKTEHEQHDSQSKWARIVDDIPQNTLYSKHSGNFYVSLFSQTVWLPLLYFTAEGDFWHEFSPTSINHAYLWLMICFYGPESISILLFYPMDTMGTLQWLHVRPTSLHGYWPCMAVLSIYIRWLGQTTNAVHKKYFRLQIRWIKAMALTSMNWFCSNNQEVNCCFCWN